MPLSKQELFNNAWNGLKSQGFERSIRRGRYKGDDPTCLYRKSKTCRCAIGWSIDDDHYRKAWDKVSGGVHVSKVAKRIPDVLPGGYANAEFLSELQQCHDNAWSPEQMELNLRNFAQKNSLTVPDAPPSA